MPRALNPSMEGKTKVTYKVISEGHSPDKTVPERVKWELEAELPRPVNHPVCTTVLGTGGNTKVVVFGNAKSR